MCAIAGILKLKVPEGALDRLLNTMKHRGPDGYGKFCDKECTLLHARLAVIDPAGGAQPMCLTWEGRTYTLVYNGEIYNAQELRRDLIKLGHSFSGHSDTEVVLHAYAAFGENCVDLLNGIFAFAVWEHNKSRLFLARDRIGVKPLFYKFHENGFLFASEIKTILAYPGVSAKLDQYGAAQLILLGPGRIPGSGVFQDILELEPGCRGYYEDGRLQLCRYWKLIDRIHTDSFEETAEKVRFLVMDSIKRQMVSDVPIGTFLSGGLDSSIITAVCAKEMEEKGQGLKTFSVDYLNNEQYFQSNKYQPNTDTVYIRIMQQALHTEHRWTVLTPEDLEDHLEEATYARDLPGMADVDFSLLAFCKEIRKDVTVALSGECADEIFGGYPWYRDPEIRALEGFPWAQNTADRCRLLSDAVNLNGEEFIRDAYQKTCAESDILPENTMQERRMKEMVNLNFRWFMQTLLDRKDRMSMRTSLEVRVPFCDHRIAEYLYGVPWAFKDCHGMEKGLLRKAMEGLLPREVLYRKKSPYPKTFDPRYEQLLRVRLDKLLQEKDAPIFYLVRREEIQHLLEKESPWPWYGQLMRRPQIIAYLLQLDHWLRRYHVEMNF